MSAPRKQLEAVQAKLSLLYFSRFRIELELGAVQETFLLLLLQ
jgi:hypothetical protein